MKQLQLELQERLLIVEYSELDLSYKDEDGVIRQEDVVEYSNEMLYSHELERRLNKITGEEVLPKYEFICKGDELTEEVAKGLVEQIYHPSITFYKDYNSRNPEEVGFACEIRSFTSAIEANGYYWKKNELTDSITAPDIEEWNELQSITFNPSRTLIFKIS